MKKWFPIAIACAALLSLAATPAPQDPSQSALEKRVAALEEDLAEQRRLHAETRALLDETLAYLDTWAQDSQKLLGVLDASEQAGFTAGINFRSRELMLAGFREYWNAQSKGLPAPKAKKKATPPEDASQR